MKRSKIPCVPIGMLVTVSFLFPVFRPVPAAAADKAADSSRPYGAAFRAARTHKFSPLSDSFRPLRKTPSSSTVKAFRDFSLKHGNGWRARYNPRTALPEAMIGGRTGGYAGSPEEAAFAFLSENKELLNIDTSQLRLITTKDFAGVSHLDYRQFYKGLPVEFSYVRVHLDRTGAVIGYQAKFEPEINLSLVPLVAPDYAVSAALADSGGKAAVKKTSLVIYPDETDGVLKLAWKLLSRGGGAWVYYIDAANGKVLFKYDDLRYACGSGVNVTTGTVRGTVYDISPIPTGNNNPAAPAPESEWTQPVYAPIPYQYVWVGSYSTFTRTDADGQYCHGTSGKVFASLKGPYFAVTNFRGKSAHFDNGGGSWQPGGNSVHTPNPYVNSQLYQYTVNITDNWTAGGYTFAKVMPHFSATTAQPFEVGALSLDGTPTDNDEVDVKNPVLEGNNIVGSYIGRRTTGFYGASVEYPSYSVELQANGSDAFSGFTIDVSSYMVLTLAPGTANNATGSIVWSTSTAAVELDKSLDTYGASNSLAEVNAFYHLNKARMYFGPLNVNPANSLLRGADLDGRVPVMVHAHGEADNVTIDGGMLNAYYDFDHDNIMIGDGPMVEGKFRSFALDGTIVRHEYIHKVVNQIYPIINFGEFGAISEAMADFFSLASFWSEGKTISILGNFIGAGEASNRDISGTGRVMPGSWAGEVHDDSLILSQALYSLSRFGDHSLGTIPPSVPGGIYDGQERLDVFVFNALFYFPDNFSNFRDALELACRRLDPSNCEVSYLPLINEAFLDHGIAAATLANDDPYEQVRNNNGPEYATDASSMPAVSGMIDTVGDADYYSLLLNRGAFTAKLFLPPTDATYGLYSAFTVYLFDANRKYLASGEIPVYNPDAGGGCPMDGTCQTQSASVTLQYDISVAGRYYVVVTAGPNDYGGNSNTVSHSTYTLAFDYTPQGSAAATVYTQAFDNDEIEFTTPYTRFNALMNPSSPTYASAEMVFEYAQLRDHNYRPLDRTKAYTADGAGTYLALVAHTLAYDDIDYLGRYKITGRVKVKPGFAAAYPGVGTVHLEIFGRNRLGSVVSLGVSGALNLSTNRSDAVAYNNVLNASNARAIIKYDVQSGGTLSIKVYTQSGGFIKTVFDGSVPAGKGTVDWDGTNIDGSRVASGVYFLKVKGPGLNKVVKVAVVR